MILAVRLPKALLLTNVSQSPRTQTGLWLTCAFYGAVLVLLALPLFSVTVPPLGDYANHLARMHILAAYSHSPALQHNYVISWRPAPYLGMDLIIPPLVHVMSIYTAGRLFLFLCLALFVAGTAAIHAALFHRFSPWPAASALFAYNYVLGQGFVNYLFGVGIWLLAFAAWIALSQSSPVRRILFGVPLVLAVFFSHYLAFLGFLLCVVAYELGAWFDGPDRSLAALLRRGIVAATPFLLPLLLLLIVPKGQTGGITRYGALADKLIVPLTPVSFPGARFDLTILAFAGVVFVVGLATGRLKLAPPMYAPLIALALAAMAMPNLLSGVWALDYRYPFVLVMLLIAASRWQGLPPRLGLALAGVMAVLLAANIASILAAWRPIGVQYDEFRAALPAIARGARVIAFRDDRGIDPRRKLGPFSTYAHLPALAVIERDVYLPFLFKNPMMPVNSAPGLRATDTPHGHPIELADLIAGADPVEGPAMLGALDSEGRHNYWGGWPAHYDYAIELNFGARPALPAQLALLKSGRIFSLYRITR